VPSPEDSGRPVGNPGPTGGASYLPVPDAITVDATWASFMFGVVIRPLLFAAESFRSSNERYVERSRHHKPVRTEKLLGLLLRLMKSAETIDGQM
jgi:hypothetical protein